MAWRRGLLAGVVACAGALLLSAGASAQSSAFTESVSGSPVEVGAHATLTFTITPPDALSPFTSVSFTDSLPSGIQLVGTPDTSMCVGGNATSSTPSAIIFSDVLVPSACTVTASVEGIAVGHWDNPVTLSTAQGSETTGDVFIDVAGPPSIAAAFGTDRLGLDGTTSLTFTITNPNSAVTLTGVGFADALPAGLALAGAPVTTCGGAVGAPPGSSEIALSDGQIPPAATCSVTATVVATVIGAMSDVTGQVTSHEGGAGNTASASLTVLGAPIVNVSSPSGGRVYAFGQKVRASFGCVDDPNGPGIGACQGTVTSGSLIDTGKAGAHTFTVTATSLDGGIASDTVFYTVAPDSRFTLGRAHVGSDGSIAFAVRVPGPGTITVLESAGSHPFARGRATARRAGTLRLIIPPNASGRLALRRGHVKRVSVTVTFTPRGGTRATKRFSFVA